MSSNIQVDDIDVLDRGHFRVGWLSGHCSLEFSKRKIKMLKITLVMF